MPYKRDYKKKWADVFEARPLSPDLAPDLCCDGCGEHCQFSLQLQVKDKGFNPIKGSQKFVIKPVMFAGGVKLFDVGLYNVGVDNCGKDLTIDFYNRNAEDGYKTALKWCRVTCKNSKVR